MSLSLAGGLLCHMVGGGWLAMLKLNAIRMYSFVFKGFFCLISYVSWPRRHRTTPTCWAIKPQTLKAKEAVCRRQRKRGGKREREPKRAQPALWIYVKLQMNAYTNTNTNTHTNTSVNTNTMGYTTHTHTYTHTPHAHEIHTPITLKYECDMQQRGAATGDEFAEIAFVMKTKIFEAVYTIISNNFFFIGIQFIKKIN